MHEDIGNWKRSHYSAEVPKKDDADVTLMGWVRAIRKVGKLTFLQVADREGVVQVIFKGVATEMQEKLDLLQRESVVAIKGKVKVNKTAPGGLEILPDELKILNLAEAPLPLEVVKGKTPAELLTRLNSRFMDLRKPEVAAIFNVMDTVKISFLNYFDQKNFININPPLIVSAATEGGADLFPVKYFDKEAFLAQSPQLYKQMIMASGLDKVSIVCPVFRAEPHATYRHVNQLTQMDIELAFIRSEEDVLKLFDDYFAYMLQEVKKRCGKELEILGKDLKIKLPIKRLTYDETLKELGKMGVKLEWGEDLTPEAERKICEKFNPVLITKWPTEIKSFYCMTEPDNPKLCRAFDLLFNGIEISSGAQRVHSYEDLVTALKIKGLKPENFKFYLDAFKFGMPSHAGWSIGLERLVMALLELPHIKEATLFPRTKELLTP
jgi:nondiscriminating aspartyl-tRNA synthetase